MMRQNLNLPVKSREDQGLALAVVKDTVAGDDLQMECVHGISAIPQYCIVSKTNLQSLCFLPNFLDGTDVEESIFRAIVQLAV